MVYQNILKKLLILFALVLPVVLISNSGAETCPNFDKMKFKSLAEYNKYKETVEACYIMPNIAPKEAVFPIVFHQTKVADISSAQAAISKQPPFIGDKVVCHVSWSDKNHTVATQVILNEKIKTTSADWHYSAPGIVSCDEKVATGDCCQFSQELETKKPTKTTETTSKK